MVTKPESFMQYCRAQGMNEDEIQAEWDMVQRDLNEHLVTISSICPEHNVPRQECLAASCDCVCNKITVDVEIPTHSTQEIIAFFGGSNG